jgi:anthranilate synthase/aminodeoxychorismate synthase-like glutamine amidotransferase
MILVIDNYDSFVYNLARYLRELGCDVAVARNDELSVSDVARMKPQAIVLSPGPCTPSEAGISLAIVRELSATIPILGVCLGHQAIGQAFGARVERAPRPVHGSAWPVQHEATRLFDGLPNPLRAGRYHSLCLAETTLPRELQVTARTADGVVMAIEHASLPLAGVQFHPESVLTQSGHRLLANFLSIAGVLCRSDAVPGDLPKGDAADDETRINGMPVHW